MEFSEYLEKAWNEHGNNPEVTAASIESGLGLCRSADDVNGLIHLTTHLYSDHLPRFTEGERKLREIGQSEFAKGTSAEFAVARSIAAFRICEGVIDPVNDRMGLTPADLARALAIAATALSVRASERSERFLREALKLADTLDLSTADGVARSLAVTGNNTAASLEEVPTLSDQQKRLMLLAAETGRKFWEIAGTWLQVERAEVRWALSCMKALRFDEARSHARLAIEICQKNDAKPIEFFLGYEAVARIEKNEGSAAFAPALRTAEEWFEKISPDENAWARDLLKDLKS